MARLSLADSAVGRSAPAEQMKQAALRLFAEKGVDGVTVREIAAAAGQKNHGAVGYYFGSKEALVREVIRDGALALERLRNAALDELESRGGPNGLREVVDILIEPVVALKDDDYIRFVTLFGMTHRSLLLDAIEPQSNRAYGRCLDHLRRLLPQVPAALQNQRFVFMGAYLSAVLSARARALANRSRQHPIWSGTEGLEHFARTVAAILEAPLDPPTESTPAVAERPSPERLGPTG